MSIRNNLNLKKELDQRNEELHGKDTFLGKDLLTYPNKMNSSRNIMFNSHLDQFVVLAEPEFPRVFTNYENQVGSYSSSYTKSDRKWEVVKKISKYGDDTRYVLVVKDEAGYYDVFERKTAENLTESYCYVNVNKGFDSKAEGDVIEPNELLSHSTSFDDDMVYRYGVNANAVYMIHNATIEDAIVVSESFANKLDSYYLDEIAISINTNDILCNLYGDGPDYKSFPDVGEKVNNEILASRRRINYDTALYDLKSENLRHVINNLDTVFYSDGVVVDIDVYSNQDIDELKMSSFNDQIVKYIDINTAYYQEIVDTLKPIIYDPDIACSEELTYMYRCAKDWLDPKVKFVDKTDFDGVYIIFRVLKRNKLHIGTKLTGRYGNKGVVSRIEKDCDMPMNEYGEHAEIIFNSLGVCNRLNPAQLYELELNFVAHNVMRKIKELRTYKQKLVAILDLVQTMNAEQAEALQAHLATMDTAGIKAFVNETEQEGIYIHQPPFWDNIGFDRLKEIYEKYDYVKPYTCTYKGKPVIKPLIFGHSYVLKLKHEPKGKFSARSSAYINMKGSPSKSTAFKKNQDMYSTTPIRLGEMEIENLLLTQSDEVVKLTSTYSSSEVNRQHTIEQLLTADDIFKLEEIELKDPKDNHNRRILDVYLKSLGVEISDGEDE